MIEGKAIESGPGCMTSALTTSVELRRNWLQYDSSQNWKVLKLVLMSWHMHVSKCSVVLKLQKCDCSSPTYSDNLWAEMWWMKRSGTKRWRSMNMWLVQKLCTTGGLHPPGTKDFGTKEIKMTVLCYSSEMDILVILQWVIKLLKIKCCQWRQATESACRVSWDAKIIVVFVQNRR